MFDLTLDQIFIKQHLHATFLQSFKSLNLSTEAAHGETFLSLLNS